MKPLERLPSIRQGPSTQHLPFGPRNVFSGRIGGGPLIIGGEEVGFFLDYTGIREHPTGRNLNWVVTAKLARVDSSGHPIDAIASRQVDGLRFPSKKRLAFQLHEEPALYRMEIVFRDGSGKKLARYGEYLRVLRPRLDARLTLARNTFYPGEGVVPRLENEGTEPLFHGLSYSIESFDGSSWARAAISPTGPTLLIGLWTGPGEASSCWGFTIPPDAAPGLYRFVWTGDVAHRGSLGRSQPLTLTSEFEILPSA